MGWSRNKSFKLNVTRLKIPTGKRQTSWLFYKRGRGMELRSTMKQLKLWVRAGLEPRSSGFQVGRPNHLFTLLWLLSSKKHLVTIMPQRHSYWLLVNLNKYFLVRIVIFRSRFQYQHTKPCSLDISLFQAFRLWEGKVRRRAEGEIPPVLTEEDRREREQGKEQKQAGRVLSKIRLSYLLFAKVQNSALCRTKPKY